jgi:hypothetical protein
MSVGWGRLTADGHAAELHCLTAHALGARDAQPCLIRGVPAIVAVEGSTLVAATAHTFYRASGPASARRYGSHWIIEAAGVQCTHLGRQALRLAAQAHCRPTGGLPDTP